TASAACEEGCFMAYDSADLRSYFEHHFTYIAGFERNVARYRNRTAMIDPGTGRTWSYAQLSEEVDELASAFVTAGVGRGDRVVYQLYNTPEFVIVYLATQRIGAIGVPINFRLSPGETAFILQDSDPRVYLYAQRAASIAEAALSSWEAVQLPSSPFLAAPRPPPAPRPPLPSPAHRLPAANPGSRRPTMNSSPRGRALRSRPCPRTSPPTRNRPASTRRAPRACP